MLLLHSSSLATAFVVVTQTTDPAYWTGLSLINRVLCAKHVLELLCSSIYSTLD